MSVSLTTRLLAFFLGALAALLIGFSATLYLLARYALYGHVDERLEATLNTLAAAVEFDAEGLEWEPNPQLAEKGFVPESSRRIMTPDHGPEADQVRWIVTASDNSSKVLVVDRSRHRETPSLVTAVPFDRVPAGRTLLVGQPWRVVRRRLESDGEGRLDGDQRANHYATLTFTAGLNLRPVDETLDRLLRVSASLSLGLWLVSALLGRGFCRRALVPVARMAEAARGMGAAELERRLPASLTGDELQDLSDSFNDLLARLQEAFERQRRFTGDASHQLRTPLAAMLGQVEVALRRERPADDYRRVLLLVRDQAAHLGRIVETLLFLARADAEAKLPDLDDLDLAAWLSEHLRNWSEHPRAPDLTVEIIAEGPLTVRVHPPLMAQLLDNLIDNACKYSAPGTPVTVRLAREADAIALSVEDCGVGIADGELPHIFEPFYRSPQARREGRPGVGLGLSVAHRIAAAFDGALVANSTLGRGSRFVLLLPGEEDGSDSTHSRLWDVSR